MLGSNVKVLLVCAGIEKVNLGNTCRSPMGAGIRARETQSANAKAAAVLEKRGIKFQHMAQQFLVEYFQDYDYILCMDKGNLADLATMKPEKCRADIAMIGSFGELEQEVPDPYGGTVDDYETAYVRLNQFCDEFVEYFVNKTEI
ncbi:hypothetical protein HDV01_005566 [Terramyces sp. JEL0728]|nr:hypothetical protein HDV01_005566 [Terramyces sp. JEL0728]